ncbi:MAG TPA: type 1 glutamine amidotransferase domain-containing protein [Gammaproteobacteria bacterium]|nr:type 1 glutamine amidotransferase domain-containing protein [Gammaproteobacteria bacterium]
MELHGQSIAVLAEDWFEDLEFWYPFLRLREAGAHVVSVGTGPSSHRGKHGLTVRPMRTIEQVEAAGFDAVVIPGGYAPDRLRRHRSVIEFVRGMADAGAVVAFICHAGWVPASAGILHDRQVTSFFSIRDDLHNAGARWIDEPVVRDGNLISSRGPDDLPQFCRAIIERLAGL